MSLRQRHHDLLARAAVAEESTVGAAGCRGVVVVVDRELRVVPDLPRLLGLYLELWAAVVLQNHAVRLRGFSKRLLAAA